MSFARLDARLACTYVTEAWELAVAPDCETRNACLAWLTAPLVREEWSLFTRVVGWTPARRRALARRDEAMRMQRGATIVLACTP
ncbi:MAG: hypothetical protein Q7V62_17050 [Actinomycetota bacterium]|nr:hypothetical protein [Actinomycetota bacterium]